MENQNLNDAATNPENTGIQETQTVLQDEKRYLLPRVEKDFVLTDGRSGVVKKAKGKHSMRAADMALAMYGNAPSAMQMMVCLISLVTTIGGDGIRPDELEDLWAEDFTTIQSAYLELSGGFQ